MTTINHYNAVTSSGNAPKGSAENPYTYEEFMSFDEDEWPGGYVLINGVLEYRMPTIVIPGSSTHYSDMNSDPDSNMYSDSYSILTSSDANQNRPHGGGGGGNGEDPDILEDDVYSQQEAESLIASGQWQGGIVEGIGYVLPQVTILPTGANSDYFSGPQILQRAQTFEGTQYVYGGMSLNGMDCSGLITAALGLDQRWTTSSGNIPGMNRITVPQDSYDSFLSALQTGDVLVWSNSTHHAVIYVEGNNIYHAHSTGVNTTGDLRSYWLPTFGYPKVYRSKYYN